MATLYTIGFSGKKQDTLVEVLDAVGVKTLIDIRLWRTSRFVPWANGTNLQNILGDRYLYIPELAPTRELLAEYKDGVIDWAGYERIFNGILSQRHVEKLFQSFDYDNVCFFCAEKRADHCHRRLVTEYLAQNLNNIKIVHL